HEEDRNGIERPGDPPPTDPGDCAEDRELKDDCGDALTGNASLHLALVRASFQSRRAEIDRKERRREVEELQPARIDLGREIVSLRISLFRSELGVVIEMPSRELRCGDAAGNRVEKSENAIETVLRLAEDRAMHDFVQQHRAIED